MAVPSTCIACKKPFAENGELAAIPSGRDDDLRQKAIEAAAVADEAEELDRH